MARKVKILLLFSGGLDSLLAARLLIEAGAEVTGLHFITPFTGSKEYLLGEKYMAEWGIEIHREVIDLAGFRHLLDRPPHGFGRALNPCIDCKILFMHRAKQVMVEEGFDAVASGEVVGERPMSQNRQSLDVIERDGELEGLLLRPLSAQLLPQTEVEKRGLLDREKLTDIQGRNRQPQLAMARKWGIEEYATPSGGCLLTEPLYSKKLKDLLDRREASDETVGLLKTGRHFRSPDGIKLIVGRNQEENEKLLDYSSRRNDKVDVVRLEADVPGPVGLLFFYAEKGMKAIEWGARIVTRYADTGQEKMPKVFWWGDDEEKKVIYVEPATPPELDNWRI